MAAPPHVVETLMQQADSEARRGNRKGALALYEQVLQQDSANETALWRCALLTQNVYEARAVLHRLLQLNPDHPQARAYYDIARQRIADSERLISHSSLVAQWEDHATHHSQAAIPLLGDYLIAQGILTPLQVRAALHFQEAERHSGNEPERLGETLVSFGYLNRAQLVTALAALQVNFNNRLAE